MVVCEEKGGMDESVWLMGLVLKGRQMPNSVCVCVCVCLCEMTASQINRAELTF